MEPDVPAYQTLAAYQHCVQRLNASWSHFRERRTDRLRHGAEAERVAEAILEDLFTAVLDWSEGDVTYQVEYADIVLSHHLAKYLVVEVKRPGYLSPGGRSWERTVDQAKRYADAQKIKCVAASDGRFFYAADIVDEALKQRIFVDLSDEKPPLDLWWVSVHGIYRPREAATSLQAVAELDQSLEAIVGEAADPLLHPKYKLPARCFAYVPDANKPSSWKLPYLCADGSVDLKRLPKAIQSLLSNYRGARVGSVPEAAIPEILIRLARAADASGRLPPNATKTAPAYEQLALTLQQLGLSVEHT